MRPEIKFCGLTRPADAALAVSLGASYIGAILVGGPRRLSPVEARALFDSAPGPRRVAVVKLDEASVMAAAGREANADILQVHADPTLDQLRALRALWSGGIWPVVRLGADAPRTDLAALFDVSDAVVVDTLVPGGLGGSGQRFDWNQHRAILAQTRGNGRLVLAGGLTSDNISEAVRALVPDVVDVSSGVEDAPGQKSPVRMQAFAEAVATTSPSPRA